MKPVIKKRGIILNSKDYKDNFKLLTILTIDGPMHVILKGANKMSSGTKKYTITPLEVDFLISQGKTISTFTEGYIINNYTNLKNSYDKNLDGKKILDLGCDNGITTCFIANLYP